MGVVYSIFSSVHMSFRIRKIVYGHANESKTLLIGYFIRLAVMLVLFTVLYLFHIGDLLCALIGMFSMKVSAYLQPFTNKILSKRKVRVGSTMMTSLVACDSSFMIKSLCSFRIPGLIMTSVSIPPMWRCF